MHWVSMTDFFTRCWPSEPPSRAGRWAWCWLFLVLWVCPARAQTQAELLDVQLRRQDGHWLLTAQARLELGASVEEALLKGIPVHFVAQAELQRERWYWYDQVVSQVSRYYRLAYQPLTRKWRLNVATEPLAATGAASSLSQTFDSLPEALGPLQRISGWKIVESRSLSPDQTYVLQYRFRLDTQQLPRPFQFGTGGQADWNLSLGRKIKFRPEPAEAS